MSSKDRIQLKERKFCINCGSRMPPYSKFCPFCGVRQPRVEGKAFGKEPVKEIAEDIDKISQLVSLDWDERVEASLGSIKGFYPQKIYATNKRVIEHVEKALVDSVRSIGYSHVESYSLDRDRNYIFLLLIGLGFVATSVPGARMLSVLIGLGFLVLAYLFYHFSARVVVRSVGGDEIVAGNLNFEDASRLKKVIEKNIS